MRVLVAGPYPPSADVAAPVTVRTVRRLLAEGHDVTVVSPLPSAAELVAPLAGGPGAAWLGRAARRYDALHLVVSTGILFRPELPKARRVAEGGLMAAALRAWKRTSVDLGDLSEVPGGGGGVSGRLVWQAVGTVLVSAEPVRNHVVTVLGVAASKVVVSPDAEAPAQAPAGPLRRQGGEGPAPALDPWDPETVPDWATLQEQIRTRAAADRGDAP
ncbi:MAG TPA: hypothetical protein VFW71_03410 [Actinomycetota bacterium]|nr:hypothetical protein [Actinomycetota bacterium]